MPHFPDFHAVSFYHYTAEPRSEAVYSSTPQPRPCLLRNHKSPPLTFAPVVLRPSHKTAKFCTSPVTQPHHPIFLHLFWHHTLMLCSALVALSRSAPNFFARGLLRPNVLRPSVLPKHPHVPLPTYFSAGPPILFGFFFAINRPWSPSIFCPWGVLLTAPHLLCRSALPCLFRIFL